MTKQLTKTYPRYQLISPATRWEARPRALTYVCRDLPAYPLPQPISPDIVAADISGLTIINIYRPPDDPVTPRTSSSTPSTLHTLLQQYYNPPAAEYHCSWGPQHPPPALAAPDTNPISLLQDPRRS
jgi:hypothetical protein